eukprot:6759777-Karenia_brevis.AAC.1
MKAFKDYLWYSNAAARASKRATFYFWMSLARHPKYAKRCVWSDIRGFVHIGVGTGLCIGYHNYKSQIHQVASWVELERLGSIAQQADRAEEAIFSGDPCRVHRVLQRALPS